MKWAFYVLGVLQLAADIWLCFFITWLPEKAVADWPGGYTGLQMAGWLSVALIWAGALLLLSIPSAVERAVKSLRE